MWKHWNFTTNRPLSTTQKQENLVVLNGHPPRHRQSKPSHSARLALSVARSSLVHLPEGRPSHAVSTSQQHCQNPPTGDRQTFETSQTPCATGSCGTSCTLSAESQRPLANQTAQASTSSSSPKTCVGTSRSTEFPSRQSRNETAACDIARKNGMIPCVVLHREERSAPSRWRLH